MSQSAPSYAIVCTGLGNVFRGYEASTHELYSHLNNFGNFRLYAGGQKIEHGGSVLWNIPRAAAVYDILPTRIATFYRRYQIECWTAGASLLRALRRNPADVVFTPDHLLAEFLLRSCSLLSKRPKIIFSNGAPFPSSYCVRYNVVHQKSLVDYEEGAARFGDRMKSYLIPNGFDRTKFDCPADFNRSATRRRHSLPAQKRVVLCLAALQTTHKRLDYLISEFAELPAGEFHLALAGARTEETNQLQALASTRLPAGNFTIMTLPPEVVPELIWSSDLAVLCSLSEGFPRAVAEAMGARRFILVHPHANIRWILQNPNCYVDMQCNGALRKRIVEFFKRESDFELDIEQNYRRFIERFTWDALIPKYLEMFKATAKG